MHFRSTLIALVGAVAFVQAADLRQLWSFPGGDGASFCKAWKCNW